MNIDKFLAWLNVRLWMLEAEMDKLPDGKRKHEIYVKIHEIKNVKDSYCRIKGESA